MKTIPLTRGQFALVDDDDFERVSKHRWHAHMKNGTFYVTGYIKGSGKYIRRKGFEVVFTFNTQEEAAKAYNDFVKNFDPVHSFPNTIGLEKQ